VKQSGISACLFLALVFFFSCSPQTEIKPVQPNPSPSAPLPSTIPSLQDDSASILLDRAENFITQLGKQEYAAVVSHFDEKMKQLMPSEKLKESWETLLVKTGAFQQITGARMEKIARNDVVFVTCQFEKLALDAKIVFDGDNHIGGLLFLPTRLAVTPNN
jgi:hypothetical protein